MVRTILCAFVLSALSLAASAASPKVIAHRGFWKAPGAAQNSIRSLVAADSIHAYGSEFDVWLTTDSVLVVNHDPSVGGVIIENSTSADVLRQHLANGETVPTLEAYLAMARRLHVRLICELKPHSDKAREAYAAQQIIDMVAKFKLKKRVDYITFSLPGMKALIKYAPKGTHVYYLDGKLDPQQLKDLGAAGMDYYFTIFQKHPEWITECHRLGLKTNAWTVNKPEDMQWCIDNDIDFITTNEPVQLQHLIAK
jgi:glycerophosphoryl diester phosphodiesterase